MTIMKDSFLLMLLDKEEKDLICEAAAAKDEAVTDFCLNIILKKVKKKKSVKRPKPKRRCTSSSRIRR